MTPPDTSVALMVPNPCSVCGLPITKDAGTIRGTGDGSMKDGGSFAHNDCYWRQRAETAEADRATVVKGRDEARAEVARMVQECDAMGRTTSDQYDKCCVAEARAETAEKERDEARATVARFEKLMAEIVAAVAPDLKNDIWCGSLAQAVEATAARADAASRQLAEARAALAHAASTFRWYADLHRAKGDDPANVEKIRRNEEEALKCERALLSGETK